MPVKPITGVRQLPPPSWMRAPAPRNPWETYGKLMESDVQMLRRGLVLDLSVAFGEFLGIKKSIGSWWRELTFLFARLGLGTSAGYLWWYGM